MINVPNVVTANLLTDTLDDIISEFDDSPNGAFPILSKWGTFISLFIQPPIFAITHLDAGEKLDAEFPEMWSMIRGNEYPARINETRTKSTETDTNLPFENEEIKMVLYYGKKLKRFYICHTKTAFH